ncbi:MAG: exopolysaccharide biosynthesis protein [Pseudomonadota bacterium]
MSLVEASPHQPRTFSQVLEDLGAGEEPILTLDEVVEAFGDRGIGALILVLALMALFPWPPGGKAVFAAPIILLAIELAVQMNEVWLPKWLLKAPVSRAAYRKATSRLIRPIRFVENLTRPRLTLFTGPVSEVVIGITCVLLAMMMALPIPFGDMLPGLALIFFALGIMQKDGAAVLLGVVGTGVCIGYLVLVWATVVEVAGHVIAWAGGLFG